mgnify:FL=1
METVEQSHIDDNENAEDLVSNMQALEDRTEKMKRFMSASYVQEIHGKQYPKVEWWNTLGALVGVKPIVIDDNRVDESGARHASEGEITWESRVELRSTRTGQVHGGATSMCTSHEKMWRNADEYAIRSMASTRATGKAYRLGYSNIAIGAGIEATPAEEMMGIEKADRFTKKPSWVKPAAQRKPAASSGTINVDMGDGVVMPVDSDEVYPIQEYTLTFGPHKGKMLKDTPLGFIQWVRAQADFSNEDVKKTCTQYYDQVAHLRVKAKEELLKIEQNAASHQSLLSDKLGKEFDTKMGDYSVTQLEKAINYATAQQ